MPVLMTLALLQSAAVAGPPAPVAPAPPPLEPVQTAPCPRDTRGDIVVCGSTDPNERYRLRPLTRAMRIPTA